ncbi:FAD:protein FMN transferase [Candidatus Sulfurimonas marisnigri]|nr:FAD:protein FMN transferase [Candidatus Sulfurimonas marisnigri]
MSKIVLLFFVLVLSLEAKTISRTQIIMSTFVTVSVEEENKNYIEDAFNIIKDVDNSISSYNPNSIIYQLNKNLFKIGLDKYSYEALTLSQRYYKRTDGYFDITIGSVTKKLYKFGEEQRVPTSKELSGAIVKIQGLHVEKEKACMEYGMQVDLGGMGKGFAVDKVAEYFRNKDVVNATIRASGDIRCLSTCMLHVQDPFSEGHLLSFETSKNDLGITTSGNYNRYVGTTKNNHLINPKLKAPQTKFISITLIGSMPSADLDAYATAASVMPTKKGYEFLNSLGVGYIVMQCDKKIIISENISKFTKNLLVNNAVKN